MRLSCVLSVVAVALLATANASSMETNAEKPSLRSPHTVGEDDAQEEERGFNLNFLDDVFYSLPEQFQRMKTQPEYLKTIFTNWKSGSKNVKEAIAYMESQKLKQSDIDYFSDLYAAFINPR